MDRFLVLRTALTFLVLGSPSIVTPGSCASAHAQDPTSSAQDYTNHFRVFTAQGEPASLKDVVRALADVDAALIGEHHTDPVGHWIQAELLREALALAKVGDESGARRPVALSLEMFQRDVQGIVDEYLQDLITENQFKGSARPWEHYDTDYRPMVEMAKEVGIAVIAANAPRRYVNRVTRLGRDALHDLPARARGFLPPLPYPQPSDTYRKQWLALMGEMPMERRCEPPGTEGKAERDAVDKPGEPEQSHAPADEAPPPEGPSHMRALMENGVHAQALWDASMAYAVTTFLEMNPGALVLHIVGGFHVERFTGIPEMVQYYRPGTRSLVVSMELADDFRSFDPEEHTGLGDFVILTDKSLDLEYARYCTSEDAVK